MDKEIIDEIYFVIDAIQDGDWLALGGQHYGTALSGALSEIIGDLLTDYLDREG